MPKRKVAAKVTPSPNPVDDDGDDGDDDEPRDELKALQPMKRQAVTFAGTRSSQAMETRGHRAQQRGFMKHVNDMNEDEQLVLAMKISREEEQKQQTPTNKIIESQSMLKDCLQDLQTPEVSLSDKSPEKLISSVSSQSSMETPQWQTMREPKSSASHNVSGTNIGASCDSKQDKDSFLLSPHSHWADDKESIQSECALKPRMQISLKRKKHSLPVLHKAKKLSTLEANNPIEFTVLNRNGEIDDDFNSKHCKVRNCQNPIRLNANGLPYDIVRDEGNTPRQVECNDALTSGDTKSIEGALRFGSSGHPASQNDVVNYYWGVPFCPVGLNPDEYTNVILCQLRTYEAVVKRQQSRLLQKVDMCVVLPEPVKTSRGRAQADGQHNGAKERLLPVSDESRAVEEEKRDVKVQGTSRGCWDDKGSDINESEGLSEEENEEKDDNEEPKSSVEKLGEIKTPSLRTLTISPPNEKRNHIRKYTKQESKKSYLYKEVKYSDTPINWKLECSKISDDDSDDSFTSLPMYFPASGTPQRRANEVFVEETCTAGDKRRMVHAHNSASKGSANPATNTRSKNYSKNATAQPTRYSEPSILTSGSFSAVNEKIQSLACVKEKSNGKITKQLGEKGNVTCRTDNVNVHTKIHCESQFDLTLDDDDDSDGSDDKQINEHGLTRGIVISNRTKYLNEAGDSNGGTKVCDIEKKVTTCQLAKRSAMVTNQAELQAVVCEADGALERFEKIPELTQRSFDKSNRRCALSLQKHKLKERHERNVPCPLCSLEFLVSDIEQHASECGISEDVHREENDVSSSSKMEVASNSRKRTTPASQKTFVPDSESNSLGSGTEGSSEDVLDGIVIADSPIKCFRTISESPDCLIDFKNQFNKPGPSRVQVSQRRTRRKR